MNIHHLELFYYVARNGGISAAARNIPYGIQQPAISAQIIQLENDLGTALFQRRPFKLTSAGAKLFEFIEPFFDGLDGMGRQIRGGVEASIRIGAPETIQREYLPRLFKKMRASRPAVHFALMAGTIETIEARVLAQEIDIGIAPLLGARAEGVKQKVLIEVPLALMVPAGWKKREAALWKQDRITDPLITGPTDNSVYRLFQRELEKRDVEWFPTLELNSQELIARYVAEGFGVGVILVEPGGRSPEGTRLLPLRDFPTVPYGLLWTGVLSPLQTAFCECAQELADELSR